jgi:hypothetical protein
VAEHIESASEWFGCRAKRGLASLDMQIWCSLKAGTQNRSRFAGNVQLEDTGHLYPESSGADHGGPSTGGFKSGQGFRGLTLRLAEAMMDHYNRAHRWQEPNLSTVTPACDALAHALREPMQTIYEVSFRNRSLDSVHEIHIGGASRSTPMQTTYLRRVIF